MTIERTARIVLVGDRDERVLAHRAIDECFRLWNARLIAEQAESGKLKAGAR